MDSLITYMNAIKHAERLENGVLFKECIRVPPPALLCPQVHSELGSISQQWEGLMSRLAQRSQHIDQAQGTSESYQTLLRDLSSSLTQLGERLDAQASLSAQPEALKQRLQETGEIRSELERRRAELGEAQRLCGELSAIVAETYLREELSKRLESVSGPLRSLEERAGEWSPGDGQHSRSRSQASVSFLINH